MTSGKIRTREEVGEIVGKLGYTFIDEYQLRNLRRVIFKDKIGYKYEVTLNSLINGYEPEIFRHTNPFTIENISLWLKINNKDFEIVDENKYINNSEKLSFYCFNCKDVFLAGWNQILMGTGCGLCSGNQVGKYNNLQYLNPTLSSEWSSKNDISPKDVTISSGLKVWWNCSVCGYEWKATISGRSSGKGCSSCVGQVLSDRNRLSILYPEISSEWHPTKNGDLTPNDVSYGTNKKFWWKCNRCGEDWVAPVNNRTNVNSACPQCANKQKESKIASFLKTYFKEKFFDTEVEYRIIRNPETGLWLPYDIYIPNGKNTELNGFYIEIHGEQHYKLNGWHKLMAKEKDISSKEAFEHQKYKDKIKKTFAKKNGKYIEVDLRKIKTTKQAIEYIENIIKKTLS